MKAELKQAWLNKLRSGEINQAQRVLRDENNAMCCLGVLLDVTAPDGWGAIADSGEAKMKCYPHKQSNSDYDFIPSDVREALGLDFMVDRYEGDGRMNVAHRLAAMNDAGKSFAEIADWIESNIPAE